MSSPAPLPILTLALAGFVSSAGLRLLDPLLPMLARDFGVTLGAASLLISGFAITYGAGQLVVGPLGDRFGKLRVICLALFLYGVLVACGPFATGLPALVVLRALAGGVAGALIPLSMAYIGDTVPYADRQVVIGKFLTGSVMAQLLVGPVAGLLGEHAGWRAPFWVLGAMAIAVGLLMMRQLGAVLWAPSGPNTGNSGIGAYLRLLRLPAGRLLMAVAFADGFCLYGGSIPFIGSYLIQTFGLSAGEAGLVAAGFGVTAFIYTRIARLLVRRLAEGALAMLGGIGLGLGLLVIAAAPHWSVVAFGQLMLGLFFYMFHGVLQARATEALPEARGTAVSAFAMALFLGQSVGALVIGTLMATWGFRQGFLLDAVLIVALAAWARARLLRPAVATA